LIFGDQNRNVAVQVADRDFVTVPYDQLDKFSYEYTKYTVLLKAPLSWCLPRAGAIVLLTKSESHWLYIDYHEQTGPKSVVLRMDKNDYKKILEAVKTPTGKEVEMPGDAKDKSKKDQKKEATKDKDKGESGQ
jgi:hypothetical protein